MRAHEEGNLELEFVDKNGTRMTWFRAFRDEFGYSYYGEYRTSVTQDIPLAAVIYACVLISVAALVAAAGIRGKERWYTLLRLIYSLAVGSIVLVSIFGYCWRMGYVEVHSPYVYRSQGSIQATLGVKIGLRTINLTLSGSFMNEKNRFDYNEEITLEDIVRGPKSELSLAINRGLPQPLLSVIEYFNMDEGQTRFGRGYWMAGYLAHIFLWTAFAFWITCNILLCSVVWYGALLFTLTGVCMVLSAIVYHAFCPAEDIKLPCADGMLELSYGWCFWSNVVLGAVTTVIGLTLFTLDQKVPNKLAEFFLLDAVTDDSGEDYRHIGSQSALSTRASTPPTPLKSMSDSSRISPTPVNWFMNYGYDPGQKENPVFIETGNAATYSAYDTNMQPRQRAIFSEIKEEDNKDKIDENEEKKENNSNGSITGIKKNAFNPVYIDIEPNSSGVLCAQQNKLLEREPGPDIN